MEGSLIKSIFFFIVRNENSEMRIVSILRGPVLLIPPSAEVHVLKLCTSWKKITVHCSFEGSFACLEQPFVSQREISLMTGNTNSE